MKAGEFLFEHRLDRRTDVLPQPILDRIVARFRLPVAKACGVCNLVHGVISLAVDAAGWVGSSHPEITPPSNFHHLRDTTAVDTVNHKDILR